MFTVAVIVGSLREASINRRLADAVIRETGDLFTFTMIDINNIPLFNQDNEDPLPAPVAEVKAAVAAADAVLFVTPEYNRGIPGVLKNVIDWGSRPHGANVWAGKPAVLMGSSPGGVATAVAQAQLRSVLTMLGMPLVRQPELYIVTKPDMYAADGSFADPSTKAFIRKAFEGINAWLAERC